MTDRPTLFSGPMVRALLDGRKTQTRRVLSGDWEDCEPPYVARYDEGARAVWCDPIDSSVCGFTGAAGAAVGDRLWVREAFCEILPGDAVLYRASEPLEQRTWQPSIHMPRWASRATLIVDDVRVERVQDISAADARAEGVIEIDDPRYSDVTVISRFERLWDSLNAQRGFGWDANPWVVALTFRVIQQNIDALPEPS